MDNYTPIFRSLAIIEERILEKLTAEKLAESIHLSKYHYQRLFREAVGDSVMRYVTRRRLTLAAAKLAQTDIAILDIALEYGYESHEGFSRSFKAFLGVTPASCCFISKGNPEAGAASVPGAGGSSRCRLQQLKQSHRTCGICSRRGDGR